jgi:hypothetical protein
MCVQCVAAAATTVGAASGLRAWLGLRRGAWITPRRLRAATLALAVLAVGGAAVGFGGSA